MWSFQNPFHVRLESIVDGFQRGERDRFFPIPDVAMVALAALVVISQDTFAVHHKSQSVFERMRTARSRIGKMPQNDLEEGRVIYHCAGLLDQHRLHVVNDDNTTEVLSMTTTASSQFFFLADCGFSKVPLQMPRPRDSALSWRGRYSVLYRAQAKAHPLATLHAAMSWPALKQRATIRP